MDLLAHARLQKSYRAVSSYGILGAARQKRYVMVILPLPGHLADLPMEISFNGRTPQQGPETMSCVTRLQEDLFKHISFSALVSGRKLFDSDDSGVEGKTSEKISIEVQAGLFERNGALFIVFQM